MILSAQGFKFVLSTAAAIVLARLLAPEDYGLIGMVSIIVGFLGMFQYLGLSTATVRWAELNHPQVSNLFWMNIGLSVAIMLLRPESWSLIVGRDPNHAAAHASESRSACSSTVWVAFSCLFGGYPSLRKIRFTITRNCARTSHGWPSRW